MIIVTLVLLILFLGYLFGVSLFKKDLNKSINTLSLNLNKSLNSQNKNHDSQLQDLKYFFDNKLKVMAEGENKKLEEMNKKITQLSDELIKTNKLVDELKKVKPINTKNYKVYNTTIYKKEPPPLLQEALPLPKKDCRQSDEYFLCVGTKESNWEKNCLVKTKDEFSTDYLPTKVKGSSNSLKIEENSVTVRIVPSKIINTCDYTKEQIKDLCFKEICQK